MKKGRDPIRVFRCGAKEWKAFCKAVNTVAKVQKCEVAKAGRSAVIRWVMDWYVRKAAARTGK